MPHEIVEKGQNYVDVRVTRRVAVGDVVKFQRNLRTVKRVTDINGMTWFEFEEVPGELVLASRCKS